MFDRNCIAAVGLLTILGTSAAWAGPIYWTHPSGSNAELTYSDGQEDKGLYGDPTVVGNTFQFLTPHDFDATAANGTAETTSDRLSFKASGVTGGITKINIQEYGDWSNFGTPAAVKDTGLLLVTNLDSGHFGVVYQLTPTVTYHNDDTGKTVTNPSFPNFEGSGTWEADYFLTLPAGGVDSLQLVLNNVLQASSAAGTTSFIQKKGVSITLVDPPAGGSTPEPASLGLLALTGTALIRRRRATV